MSKAHAIYVVLRSYLSINGEESGSEIGILGQAMNNSICSGIVILATVLRAVCTHYSLSESVLWHITNSGPVADAVTISTRGATYNCQVPCLLLAWCILPRGNRRLNTQRNAQIIENETVLREEILPR